MIKVANRWSKLDKIKDTSADISNLMAADTRKAFSNIKPKIGRLSSTGSQRSSLMSNIGRELNANATGTGAGGADAWFSFPFSYDPSVSSVDRMWLPEDRIEQNRYWRTFYATDPLCGNVLDMYAETPVSDFTLRGEGVEGTIKSTLEDMVQEVDFLQTLMYMIREFLIIGEVAPHCFFNKSKGIWTHITIHDPDRLDVFDSPLIDNAPVVELIPDDEMRKIFTSQDPRMIELRKRVPKEIMMRLVSRMNIPLSNLNMTFIARKAHPYYIRGMSLLARLFKIFIYEDALYDASVATARRHAGPLKIVKLGDKDSGWLPEPGEEDRVAELLAQCELDPHAYLIYHYGIEFAEFGTTEKIMNLFREWESVERAKLVGLGISKAFLTGEVTYASAEKGLEVWLSRLLTLRQFFETTWIKPKFFKPIAKINEWYLPTPAEVNHRVKVKHGKNERRLIIPEIEWQKSLKPAIDQDKMDAYTGLRDKGFIISDRVIMSTVGLDFKEQVKSYKEEQAFIKKEGVERPGSEGQMGGMGGMEGAPEGEGAEGGAEGGGGTVAPGGQPMGQDGLPGIPASKETEGEKERVEDREDSKGKVINFSKQERFLVGEGNKSSATYDDIDDLGDEMDGLGKIADFHTPEIDPPINYRSREDWQKALAHSKIPSEAKNFIKSTENIVADGWEKSFDSFWAKMEPMISRDKTKVSDVEVNHVIMDSIFDHLKKLDIDALNNNLTGIYHYGKIYAYEPLEFEKYKREKQGFKKAAVTMTTMEDDLLLRNMKDRLKDRLYNLTDDKIRGVITGKVQDALASAIDKAASGAEMKKALRKVYDNAMWMLQQSVRTETMNNLAVSKLMGYKEQGIKKVQWNANDDNKVCAKCRGMNGLEYDVDYLLSLGTHPVVAMTHHQCRCWLSAVINHVEWDRLEQALLSHRKKFAPAAKVEYVQKEITKPLITSEGKTFKKVPAEYVKPLKEISRKIVKDSKFGDRFPREIEFVADVASVPEFIKVYGSRDDLKNRVQYWKDRAGKVWVSNFYMRNKDPKSAFTRIWAENVWDKIKDPWKKLYARKMKPQRIPDLSKDTVERIEGVLSPVPIAIPFKVGMMRGIGLNKKWRDLGNENVKLSLKNAGVDASDIDKIVKYRSYNPSWTMDGNLMQVGERNLQEQGFVSDLAKRSAKDMFVESAASFVGDSFLLEFRDPDSYELIKPLF